MEELWLPMIAVLLVSLRLPPWLKNKNKNGSLFEYQLA
jgi:hypothetical protein